MKKSKNKMKGAKIAGKTFGHRSHVGNNRNIRGKDDVFAALEKRLQKYIGPAKKGANQNEGPPSIPRSPAPVETSQPFDLPDYPCGRPRGILSSGRDLSSADVNHWYTGTLVSLSPPDVMGPGNASRNQKYTSLPLNLCLDCRPGVRPILSHERRQHAWVVMRLGAALEGYGAVAMQVHAETLGTEPCDHRLKSSSESQSRCFLMSDGHFPLASR